MAFLMGCDHRAFVIKAIRNTYNKKVEILSDAVGMVWSDPILVYSLGTVNLIFFYSIKCFCL